MNPLVRKAREVEDKVDALSLRERVLVFLSATAVVFMLWQLVLFDAIVKQNKGIAESMDSSNKQLVAMNQEAELIGKMMALDPNELTRKKVDELKRKLEEQAGEIKNLSSPFLPPEQLSKVLESVIKQESSLTLVSVQTLAPTAISTKPLKTAAGEFQPPAMVSQGLFKHAVRLHLRGGYRDTYEYLSAMEGLPWHFYWEDLEYVVTDYPLADIFLEVYTVSTGKGVFGA